VVVARLELRCQIVEGAKLQLDVVNWSMLWQSFSSLQTAMRASHTLQLRQRGS